MDPKQVDPTPIRRSVGSRVRAELASRPGVYVLMAICVALGPILAKMIFPEAPLDLVLFGGVALGVVFGLCAQAGRILE